MKFKLTLLAVFFALPSSLLAQIHVLNGMVQDQEGKIIDGATISLQSGSKHRMTKTSDSGKFSFTDIQAGQYQLKISSPSFETAQHRISIPADPLVISLKPASKELKEVTITGKKPLIERKTDRVIFNVENSIVAGGSTVWETLNKAPGVQTNFDGSIKANGKASMIYMDDKPLRLSGDDLSTYLKNLPAGNIAKIEILSNPGARYDAQGGAVINIITKKSTAQGLNLILSGAYVQSVKVSDNAAASFNYRQNKINVYGSYGYSDSYKQHNETGYVIFETPGGYSYWENKNKGIRRGKADSYKLGLDYSLTGRQVLGVLINGTNSANIRNTGVLTQIFNQHRSTIDSMLNAVNNTSGMTDQYSYNLNYKAELDTLGQNFNIDLDFIPYRNNSNQDVISNAYLANGLPASSPYHISTLSKQKIDIWSAKADYTYIFNKKWSIETGLKYSSITTNNSFDLFNHTAAASQIDLSKSDKFGYTETTSAAYGSLNAELGKWSLQLGLRGEHTQTKGRSFTLETLNLNSYFRIFPSLFLTHKISKDNEINMNYNYRINRPEYWRLNPFKYYSSPYTYLEGNPALKPAFLHSAEIGYTYKQEYNISFYFRQADGYFSNITVQDNDRKIFYDTQRNLDKSMEAGFSISAPVSPLVWWEINNYLQASRKQEKSGYLEGSYNYHKLLLYFSTNHAFTLNKNSGLKAEFSAWYSSPGVQGIYQLDRTFDVSAGISKAVLNKQGTIRLSVTDLFYGNPYRIAVDYLNQRNGFYEKNDTRSISLAFSYHIGNKKIAGSRLRKTAGEDEKRRTR